MDAWVWMIGGAVAGLLIGLAYFCLWLAWKLCREAMAGQAKALRDQSVIVSELLAHRTLAETGNQALAGQMLAHSNAHGMRTEVPQVWSPPAPERAELQVHAAHDVAIGVEEDMDLPAPEEP